MSVQLPLGLHLPNLKTFSRFIIADNHLTIEMLKAFVTEAKEQQIYIFGSAALGKTHLLQAVCHLAHKQNKRAAYLPLHQIINESPECLVGLASLDILCIDDLQQLAQNQDWEIALFNLINQCRDNHTQLLFSADVGPKQLNIALPDLLSRLQWGPALAIKPLDDEHKKEFLLALAQSKGLTLDQRVAEYILQRYRRDIVSLEALFEQLDKASLANQRSLTIPFIKQVLQED